MNKKGIVLLALSVLFFAGNISEAQKLFYSNVQKTDSGAEILNNCLAQGGAYLEQFKLDSAQKQYEKAITLKPENSDAHNGLGLVYYLKTTSSDMDVIQKKSSFLSSAQKEFELAIKYDDKNFKAYNNLGRIYQENGELAKAQENYKKALDLNPKYSEAMSNLASVDFLKNKIPEAVEDYKKALSYDYKNLKAYLGLAECYTAQGKYTDALQEINTALSLFSNSAKAQTILGKIYDAQGNKVAAINACRKAITIKPENIEPYLIIADIYQERGDNDLAIAELKNVLSLNPNYKEGNLKLADMLVAENKPEAAISYYKKVIDDPIYSGYALKGLAKAYFYNAKNSSVMAGMTTNSDYIDAQNSLLNAIATNPQDLQLYLALLRVSKLAADDDLSQVYMSKILAQSSCSPISAVIKGEAQLLANNYEQATLEFSNAIEAVSNVQDCLYVGDIFVENRQYDMATAAFYKALDMDNTNQKAKNGLATIAKNKKIADSHYTLAQSFYKGGEKVSAIEELKQAVAYNPRDKKSQILLASSYEKIGDYQNSLAHYKMCQNLVDAKDKSHKKYTKKIAGLTRKVVNKKPQVNGDI